jgi:hypothetical protein
MRGFYIKSTKTSTSELVFTVKLIYTRYLKYGKIIRVCTINNVFLESTLKIHSLNK